ncbi:hypothetical protein R6Q59_035933 [Mikania micrantha]
MVPSSLLWRSATPATTFRRALFQPPPFYTRRMVSFLLTTACQSGICSSDLCQIIASSFEVVIV